MNLVIDHLVEDALRELAEESVQRELWLAVDGTRVSSFTECVSRLWDDSGLSEALGREGRTVYTPEIDDRLTRLRGLLRCIDESRAPEEILRDRRLHESRAAAQKLLTDLRKFGWQHAE